VCTLPISTRKSKPIVSIKIIGLVNKYKKNNNLQHQRITISDDN